MQAGRLDQVITIEALTTSRDATFSAVQQSWTPYATLLADVQFRNVPRPEQVIDEQVHSMMRVHIRARYYPGVDAKMRVNHDGKYYQILDAVVIGRNEELRLTAVEWNEGRR